MSLNFLKERNRTCGDLAWSKLKLSRCYLFSSGERGEEEELDFFML